MKEDCFKGHFCSKEGFELQQKITSPLEGEEPAPQVVVRGGRRADEGGLKKGSLYKHPLTCPSGHPLPPGARKTTDGFTLIELLVVVLVIGILAAVAVPQYQKVVEKSRLSEALQIASVFRQQAELYMLEKGLPAEGDGSIAFMDFANVDIPQESQYYRYFPSCDSRGCSLNTYRYNGGDFLYCLMVNSYLLDDYVYNKQGNWYYGCVTNDTDIGRSICSVLEQEGWGVADEEY